MKANKETSSSGGGIGLLTIVFVILKLTNVIDWSWWWVLSPIWIPTLVGFVILLIAGFFMALGYLIHRR